MRNNLEKDFGKWEVHIRKFLMANPQYAGDNTIGYFKFLAHIGAISQETADTLAHMSTGKNFPKPELYTRVRRALVERGDISVPAYQRSMLQDLESEHRDFHRQRKENAYG